MDRRPCVIEWNIGLVKLYDLDRRDRIVLKQEKQKLKNKIKQLKQMIKSTPDIHWIYISYKNDLEQELLEIITELENLCA